MNAADLIAAAMQKAELASMRELGRELGVSHTIVSRWARGERTPEFEHAAALAEMAGLPPAKTAAELRMQLPASRRVHALLKRMMSAAALLTLAVYTAIPSTANAAPENFTNAGQVRHCAPFTPPGTEAAA